MIKNYIRIASIIFSFISTASAAQTLEDIFDTLDEQVDFSKVDTGFEADKEKYAFGAKRKLDEIDEDVTLNVGVGGKLNSSPEYNLSNSYNGADSQTNRLEERFDPMHSSPMLGASIGYKF